jgi:sec-independent protein translocase protein TatB
MFNIGSGELALILVVALLVLGPKRLPELARGIGKFVREFRRQTDSVRNVVEREFYKMDQEVVPDVTPKLGVPGGAVSQDSLDHPDAHDALPPVTDHTASQLTAPLDAQPEAAPLDESDPAHPDYNRVDQQPGDSAPVAEAAPAAVPAAPEATAPDLSKAKVG